VGVGVDHARHHRGRRKIDHARAVSYCGVVVGADTENSLAADPHDLPSQHRTAVRIDEPPGLDGDGATSRFCAGVLRARWCCGGAKEETQRRGDRQRDRRERRRAAVESSEDSNVFHYFVPGRVKNCNP